jgi:hypothetical protein
LSRPEQHVPDQRADAARSAVQRSGSARAPPLRVDLQVTFRLFSLLPCCSLFAFRFRHHCVCRILNDPQCNILENLTKQQYRVRLFTTMSSVDERNQCMVSEICCCVRLSKNNASRERRSDPGSVHPCCLQTVRACLTTGILSTDMTGHFVLLEKFNGVLDALAKVLCCSVSQSPSLYLQSEPVLLRLLVSQERDDASERGQTLVAFPLRLVLLNAGPHSSCSLNFAGR